MKDATNPDHYKQGGLECIDVMRAFMPEQAFVGYCWGNVIKYMLRWMRKNGVEDLKKGKVYLEWLIKEMEK